MVQLEEHGCLLQMAAERAERGTDSIDEQGPENPFVASEKRRRNPSPDDIVRGCVLWGYEALRRRDQRSARSFAWHALRYRLGEPAVWRLLAVSSIPRFVRSVWRRLRKRLRQAVPGEAADA